MLKQKCCRFFSVRSRETEFYTQLDDWWSVDGPQKQLHKFNRVRVNFIRQLVVQELGQIKTLKAVDVGCGAGILTESLGRLGFDQVIGIDPTLKCIQLAEAHLDKDIDGLKNKIKYTKMTLEDHILEEQKYDLVCCSEVIEHVSN